jgi:hypothetical protein
MVEIYVDFAEVNLYFAKQNVKCRNSKFGFLLSVLLFVLRNENGVGAKPWGYVTTRHTWLSLRLYLRKQTSSSPTGMYVFCFLFSLIKMLDNTNKNDEDNGEYEGCSLSK